MDEEKIDGQTEIEVEIVPDDEAEVILAESAGTDEEGTRVIRVYDRARGDFTLEIPKKASVTFGYFNPAAPKYGNGDQYSRRPSDVAAATALRIYAGSAKNGSQLACFLDVQGFRDLTLKLNRLRQRVTIESNIEDDGDGNVEWGGKQMRALMPKNEDEEIPF